MARPDKRWKKFILWSTPFLCVTGCAMENAGIPSGHLPGNMSIVDRLLPVSFTESKSLTLPSSPEAQPPGKSFELPPGLPGSNAPPVHAPQMKPNASPAEREQALKSAYPALPPVAEPKIPTGQPLTLSALQQMAANTNPNLRRAQADAEAAYGTMIQAGLYPNPVVGYQVDQVQPWLTPTGNAGQQGAFISQVIKTANKLSLAQRVSGYDYLNALVAARRTQVDVISQIRSAYFALLVAQQSVEINRSLVALADEVYLLQRKQVQAGEAAGYEPLQLYAQALQARSTLTQAEANVRSSWRQLAAALGQPALAPQPIAGRADAAVPEFVIEQVQKQILDLHTDLLTARNKQLQAEANLQLQQAIPIPDLQTTVVVQGDTALHTAQFGAQIGVALPLFDRNQGNIRQAQAQIASSSDAVPATENDLFSKLAEAMSRYEAGKVSASSYRDHVLPNLVRAYKALLRRYQVEPDRVSINDIIVAQQNLGQALQTYLSSLDAQWKAVVDVANIGQLNDLYEQKIDAKP